MESLDGAREGRPAGTECRGPSTMHSKEEEMGKVGYRTKEASLTGWRAGVDGAASLSVSVWQRGGGGGPSESKQVGRSCSTGEL